MGRLIVLLTGQFYAFGMLRTLNWRSKLREQIHDHKFGRTTLTPPLTTWSGRTAQSRWKRRFMKDTPKVRSHYEFVKPNSESSSRNMTTRSSRKRLGVWRHPQPSEEQVECWDLVWGQWHGLRDHRCRKRYAGHQESQSDLTCAGIGAMMAKALAQNGASKVYILGRRLEKLQETAKVTLAS